VVAPPYDIISTEAQERYYEMSEYNVIRLILGKQFPGDDEIDNKYTRAAQFLQKWLGQGILVRDPSPSIYLLEQEYGLRSDIFGAINSSLGEGKPLHRRGFIALLQLEEFSKGIIRPHEATMAEPKRDRLNLIRACRANFCQVFTTYEDLENIFDRVWERKIDDVPLIDITEEENIRHRLWRIDDEKTVRFIVEGMRDKRLFIADGHHRYESALEYRNEMRKSHPEDPTSEAYNYVMSYFVNMEGGGLKILPIHRAVRKFEGFERKNLLKEIAKYFDVKMVGNLNELLLGMRDQEVRHRMGMFTGKEEFYLLSLKDGWSIEGLIKEKREISRKLDVVILHSLVIEKILGIPAGNEESITYSEKISEVVSKVRDGSHCVAFFLRPVRVSEFRGIVEAGEIMPKKTTFFYPKLLSGLVINKFD